MKTFFNLFSEPVVSAFGWTLVHSLWQGAVLALVASFGFYLLRKNSASARYNLGVLSLGMQVLASVATFVYYYMRFSVKANPVTTLQTAFTQQPGDWKALTYELSFADKIQVWLATHIQELVICWMIGAVVLLLRFAAGWIYTEHLRHSSKPVINKEWRARFGVLIAKLNIYQSIELKESSKIFTPMVIGSLQPIVLIPIGFLTGFTVAQVEAILAHELAHIRRHDYLVNILQSFVEVIFFFHPALWWLSEKIRVERENSCDDLAMEVCNDRLSLAHALVGIAEWKTNHSLAMAFASRKPLLLQRVKRVLGVTTPKTNRMFGSIPFTLFFIAALVGASYYAVGQENIKKKKKARTHQVTKKLTKITSDENDIEVMAIAEPEIMIDVADVEEDMHIDLDLNEHLILSDSTKKEMSEIHRRMAAIHKEMEPLHRRMEELHFDMEKSQFDIEHFQRDQEKLEWKKDHESDLRQELMEKRSALLHPDPKNGKAKLSEAEIEKQLAAFEQQIKTHEDVITRLNAEISNSRKEALKAEEPNKRIEKEMEDINQKLEELGEKMEIESREIGRLMPPPPPARAPRAPKAPRVGKMVPPPPPPAAVKAAPAAAPKPPVPPTPVAKK